MATDQEGRQTTDPRALSGDATGDQETSFFQRSGAHEAAATFAKTQAQATAPLPTVILWLRQARPATLALVALPVATAGVLVWALGAKARPLHLIALFVGAALALAGVNLLRAATRRSGTETVTLSDLMASPLAHAGDACLGIAVLCGIVLAQGQSRGTIVLGLVGLGLAAAYVALPLVLRAAPGIEALAAIALGPVLFFLALAVQDSPVGASALTWLLALGLGCLAGATVLARRLYQAATPGSTLALVGRDRLRGLFVALIVLAYGFVVAAGLSRHAPHAIVAVLLSVPVAVLPLSGALSAHAPAALFAVAAQTRRLTLVFGGWLLGGLILGVIYLHALALVHRLPGVH